MRTPLLPRPAVLGALLLVLSGCEPTTVTVSDDGVSPAFSMHDAGRYADVMNQGGDGVYAAGGAHVVRQPKGLRMSVRMPTPPVADYTYPEGIEPGHPEVFTLWAFIFNHPESCTDGECGGDDLGADADAKGSVYNVAGHVTSGRRLTLAGRIGVGQPALAPPGVTPTPLSNPEGAEIHLAVTSHGGLDPSTLPGEFRSPTGSPVCDCWWVALFK